METPAVSRFETTGPRAMVAPVYPDSAEWRQLQDRLDAKLKSARGVDWELVSLEFQRDLWLLAASFDWLTRIMDREFEDGRKASLR